MRAVVFSLGLAGLLLAAAPEAAAQSSLDILVEASGHRLGEQQDSTFLLERFEAGFRGAPGDSAEASYLLGLRVGRSLRADTVSRPDAGLFLAGFRGGVARSTPRYTPFEATLAQAVFQDSLRLQSLEQQAALTEGAREFLDRVRENQRASDAFLAEALAAPGAQRTPSGVVYRVTEDGTGAPPAFEDQVRVEYAGRLPDGTEFDRSPEGEPVEFAVAGVVPGFTEMLLGMRPGERRVVTIPSPLAYGVQGRAPIPPAMALQFDLTLVEVLEGQGPPGPRR